MACRGRRSSRGSSGATRHQVAEEVVTSALFCGCGRSALRSRPPHQPPKSQRQQEEWINLAQAADLTSRGYPIKNTFIDVDGAVDEGRWAPPRRTCSAPPRSTKADDTVTEQDKKRVEKAVKSLVEDKIRPESVLLHRRVQELFPVATGRWTLDFLKRACVDGGLEVIPGKQKSGSAFSVFTPEKWILAESASAVGSAITQRIEEGFFDWDEVESSTTSQYELAKLWHRSMLPELGGLQLGDVHQIVNNLVKEKVVRYRKLGSKSYLVPFSRSDEHKRQQTTGQGDWVELCCRIRELMETSKKGSGIDLAHFKPKFHKRFGAVLSEAAFGYGNLGNLLQDPRLSNVVAIKQEGTDWRAYPVVEGARTRRDSGTPSKCSLGSGSETSTSSGSRSDSPESGGSSKESWGSFEP